MIFDGVVEPAVRLPRAVVTRGAERNGIRSDAANGSARDALSAIRTDRATVRGSERKGREPAETVGRFALPPLPPGVRRARVATAMTTDGEAGCRGAIQAA
ncbi:hypothetical protein DDJ31_28600 [Streptomyces griseoviridis]|uniref:Uncharacterized protein n=1 Tax=Streptomyces griseoviridis TaxID=45398 RepID=A0ABX5U0L7_STRGD|nr:hypothetical protein DDJ31_28600 [Streptomyces griseoviridis]